MISSTPGPTGWQRCPRTRPPGSPRPPRDPRPWTSAWCPTRPSAAGVTLGTVRPFTATLAAGAALGGGRLRGTLLGERAGLVALVDPHLHADPAERRLRLEEAVVDVSAQRVQRHPTLAIELRAAHFGAAEAARALHPDALHLRRAERGLHRLAHGAAEAHAVGQLLGHALRDELRIRLRVAHLEDVQLHLLAGELLQGRPDTVGLRAAAADDDAGARGVDVDANPVTGALDLHLGDARALHALAHQLADLDVLGHVLRVRLVRVPPGVPVGADAQAEPVRVDLLTH